MYIYIYIYIYIYRLFNNNLNFIQYFCFATQERLTVTCLSCSKTSTEDPGWQDGRRKWIHWAMVAPPKLFSIFSKLKICRTISPMLTSLSTKSSIPLVSFLARLVKNLSLCRMKDIPKCAFSNDLIILFLMTSSVSYHLFHWHLRGEVYLGT